MGTRSSIPQRLRKSVRLQARARHCWPVRRTLGPDLTIAVLVAVHSAQNATPLEALKGGRIYFREGVLPTRGRRKINPSPLTLWTGPFYTQRAERLKPPDLCPCTSGV